MVLEAMAGCVCGGVRVGFKIGLILSLSSLEA